MKTIAVVCEKGGSGKSVIANELYESYVRLGVPVSIYFLDGQYTDAASSKKADDAGVAVREEAVEKNRYSLDIFR